jgi:hypothetical protein
MTMDENVDIFANKIKNDTKLAPGFNCVSFSQGAMLCRGYIQKSVPIGFHSFTPRFLLPVLLEARQTSHVQEHTREVASGG